MTADRELNESTASCRVRLNLRMDDAGLEGVFEHLSALNSEMERGRAMRTLLHAIKNAAPLPSWSSPHRINAPIEGPSVVARFTISEREIGFETLTKELLKFGSPAIRAAYVKRLILLALFSTAITKPESGEKKQTKPASANEQSIPQRHEMEISKPETPIEINPPTSNEKSDSFRKKMRQSAAMLKFN